MYSFNSRVRYSEIDEEGRLTISSAINYMQDCTTFNSESIGLGLEKLQKIKRAWILNAWHIVICDLPEFNSEIVTKTWATGFKTFMGFRNFEICSPEGFPFVKADSLWVFIDTETGKPVKPEYEDIRLYTIEPPLELGSFERKVRLPEDMERQEPVFVKKGQIDTNGHVNNCEYVKMALEYIPDGRQIRDIHIEYRNPSYYGMKLMPEIKVDNENVYVSLLDEKGTLCSALRFIG